MLRVVSIEVDIQIVTVDNGGQRGSTEGKEDRSKDGTLSDTTRDFDRIGLGVNKYCLEPVIHIGLEPSKASVMDILGTSMIQGGG